MIPVFESDHHWTGNPAPETARFSYTFQPQFAFMRFYDYALDIMSIDDLTFSSPAPVFQQPSLAALVLSDALEVIVDFYFNESPDIADPAWEEVYEGVIAFKSGKAHFDVGLEEEVGILLDPGHYAFRVYFGECVGPTEQQPNEWHQKLAICFRKTAAEETSEVKVLKDGPSPGRKPA